MIVLMWQDDIAMIMISFNVGVAPIDDACHEQCLEECIHQLALSWGD